MRNHHVEYHDVVTMVGKVGTVTLEFHHQCLCLGCARLDTYYEGMSDYRMGHESAQEIEAVALLFRQ